MESFQASLGYIMTFGLKKGEENKTHSQGFGSTWGGETGGTHRAQPRTASGPQVGQASSLCSGSSPSRSLGSQRSRCGHLSAVSSLSSLGRFSAQRPRAPHQRSANEEPKEEELARRPPILIPEPCSLNPAPAPTQPGLPLSWDFNFHLLSLPSLACVIPKVETDTLLPLPPNPTRDTSLGGTTPAPATIHTGSGHT